MRFRAMDLPPLTAAGRCGRIDGMSAPPQRPYGPSCIALVTVLGIAMAMPLDARGQAGTSPAGEKHGADAPAYATGDAWIDGRLADLDGYAARYPDAFIAELARYAGVPGGYVQGLLAQPDWRAGDVWFACFLARATESTCRSVVRARSQAGAEAGWKRVAEGFDARPGSDAYAALRLSLADSYRRWARPLQPDAALVRALRERKDTAP